MAWSKTVPTTGSFIVDISSIYVGNWTAIEDMSALEHNGLTVVLSGRHKPGILPVITSTTTSGITAITDPSTGAMAQDTVLGVSNVFTGATWQQINLLNHSEVIAYRSTDYLITAGTTGLIPFDTESIDNLDEYNNTTYTFIAKAAGFYFIRAQASFTAIGAIAINMLIEQYNSSDILQTSPVTHYHLMNCIRELQLFYH
jgi:hypothetical protein